MTWLIPRVAVIPTNLRACFPDALAAIGPQVDKVIVVQNDGDPILGDDKVTVVLDPRKPQNISRWWNQGLSWAQRYAVERGATAWDVAILNDDVIVPPDWFDRLSETLRRTKVAVISYGDVYMPVLHSRPGPISLHSRPQGFAWMTAGEKRLKVDEDFQWWAGDDDTWQWAIKNDGAMVIPGKVNHLYPNGQMTPERHAQAAKDMEHFVAKHGFRPW